MFRLSATQRLPSKVTDESLGQGNTGKGHQQPVRRETVMNMAGADPGATLNHGLVITQHSR